MKSRRTTKRPPAAPEPPPYPRVFETYRDPLRGLYAQATELSDEPSAWNGEILFRRYEITIRRIEEPVEVLQARLVRLWRKSERHYHHTDAFYNAARDLGITYPRSLLRDAEHGVDFQKPRFS